MTDYQAWINEQEIKIWQKRFSEASNKEEWDKVYHSYLSSDIWKAIRQRILNRANGYCERCRGYFVNDTKLDVHHKTYERVGGKEKESDLIALCTPCHKKADSKRDENTRVKHNETLFESRLDGFATAKYGAEWWYEQDENEVIEEFFDFLYKQWCNKNHKRYNWDFATPEDFKEAVIANEEDEYSEDSYDQGIGY